MSGNIDSLPYRPCVGILLLNADEKIFTAERLDMPGAWQMPQGGVDDGEDVKTAALRELEEETGLPADAVKILKQSKNWLTYDLPIDLIGKLWGGKYRGQKQVWFLMQLIADDNLINIDTEIPEFGRWKWSSSEETVSEIVPFKQDLYKQIISELL